jgi:hypothetical protein
MNILCCCLCKSAPVQPQSVVQPITVQKGDVEKRHNIFYMKASAQDRLLELIDRMANKLFYQKDVKCSFILDETLAIVAAQQEYFDWSKHTVCEILGRSISILGGDTANEQIEHSKKDTPFTLSMQHKKQMCEGKLLVVKVGPFFVVIFNKEQDAVAPEQYRGALQTIPWGISPKGDIYFSFSEFEHPSRTLFKNFVCDLGKFYEQDKTRICMVVRSSQLTILAVTKNAKKLFNVDCRKYIGKDLFDSLEKTPTHSEDLFYTHFQSNGTSTYISIQYKKVIYTCPPHTPQPDYKIIRIAIEKKLNEQMSSLQLGPAQAAEEEKEEEKALQTIT